MIIPQALLRLDLRGLGIQLPPFSGSIWNILLYFIFSLVLLSLAQFSILRVHWSIERIPTSPRLAARWIIYSLVFLTVLAVIASLLPTHYSMGLLDALHFLLMVVAALINLLAVILFMPLFLLISLINKLFGRPPPATLQPFEPLKLPPQTQVPPNYWMEGIKSILFWLAFLGILSFAFYQYLKQHKDLAAQLRQIPLLAALGRAWIAFWDWLRGVNRRLVAAVDTGILRLRGRSKRVAVQPWGFLSLRRLSPRQRVMFFYLALLRRGSENGLPRKPSQTPYDYSATLGGYLPDVEHDVAEITEQFVEARYSQHAITSQHASRAQAYWERIRKALHLLR